MQAAVLFALSSLTLVGGLIAPPARAVETASLVFMDGNVLTMDDKRTVAHAVAISGNSIVAVGSNQDVQPYIGTGTKVVHLYGKTLMPGFIDAHIHPIQGAENLGKCSADDVAQPITAIASKVIKELEEQNMVMSEKCPTDARSANIFLTDATWLQPFQHFLNAPFF